MRIRKIGAFALASVIVLSLTACGKTEEETAAEAAKREAEKAEALLGMGAGNLPSGLSGSCTSGSENMSAVRLTTTGQYLGVEIDNPYIDPSVDVSYTITMDTTVGEHESLVGIKMMSTGESLRYVFDMTASQQKNYGPLGADDVSDGLLSTSIPDTAVKASKTMKWHAVMSVDGLDVATCPAAGQATLE